MLGMCHRRARERDDVATDTDRLGNLMLVMQFGGPTPGQVRHTDDTMPNVQICMYMSHDCPSTIVYAMDDDDGEEEEDEDDEGGGGGGSPVTDGASLAELWRRKRTRGGGGGGTTTSQSPSIEYCGTTEAGSSGPRGTRNTSPDRGARSTRGSCASANSTSP